MASRLPQTLHRIRSRTGLARRLAASAPVLAGTLALALSPTADAQPQDAASGEAEASGSVEASPVEASPVEASPVEKVEAVEELKSLDESGGSVSAGAGAGAGTGTKDDKRDERWIHRYAPQRHMGEIGIYGGVFFPSSRLELFGADPTLPDQGFKQFDRTAGDVGFRAGYYPLRFFGIEGEAGLMPGRTRGDDGEIAFLWAVRGHLVAQLGLWSATPFVLIGATGLGVASDRDAAGDDFDAAIHFGGGVKLYTSRFTQLRVDVRDTISAKQGVDTGITHSPEILIGFSVTLGRKKPKEEPPPLKPRPSDRDGDGFLDPDDRCPDDPGVAPDGCPIGDRDGDGFLDPDDQCPDEPGVAPDGCPIGDRDNDGFLDPDDGCPDDPETPNGFQDTDGCPDELPKEIEAFSGVIKGISFDLDKATIKGGSQRALGRAVETLKKFDGIRVEISGHTDSQGSDAHNDDLSRRRADAVKTYLVDHGIDGSRIQTRGAGAREPIDTNNTKQGRAKNRRIEFEIVSR